MVKSTAIHNLVRAQHGRTDFTNTFVARKMKEFLANDFTQGIEGDEEMFDYLCNTFFAGDPGQIPRPNGEVELSFEFQDGVRRGFFGDKPPNADTLRTINEDAQEWVAQNSARTGITQIQLTDKLDFRIRFRPEEG